MLHKFKLFCLLHPTINKQKSSSQLDHTEKKWLAYKTLEFLLFRHVCICWMHNNPFYVYVCNLRQDFIPSFVITLKALFYKHMNNLFDESFYLLKENSTWNYHVVTEILNVYPTYMYIYLNLSICVWLCSMCIFCVL